MHIPLGHFSLPEDFIGFLKSQFTNLPYPSSSFSGQTIIVTGGNTGLGFEAARHFVRLNASKVILACRNVDRGKAAKHQIEESTNRKNVVEIWQVDLSSYQSVKEFCKKAETLERLDVVVENAGIAMPNFELVEGMESTVTVNVISTFLMALLLLPKLRADGIKFNMVPHLTIVASNAHEDARFKEQDSSPISEALKSPSHQADRYNVSKLLEIIAVRELGPAMAASGKPAVIINALSPGFCHSELMRHAVFPFNFLGWLGKVLIGRTTEMGSRTLVEAARAGKESHSMYMTDCKVSEPSSWVRSEKGRDVQKIFYEELLGILEEIEPGITENI